MFEDIKGDNRRLEVFIKSCFATAGKNRGHILADICPTTVVLETNFDVLG